MSSRLKKTAVLVVVLSLFSPFSFAGEFSSYMDWRNEHFLFADNSTPGVYEKGNWLFASGEKAAGCGAMNAGAFCCDAGPGKTSVSGSSGKKSIDLGNIHKYLGYTTVLLVGLAAATAGDNGAHYGAAYGSAVAAAATVTTGFVEYGDRFDLSYGLFSEDNAHIILGTIGAVACIAAVAVADSDGGGGHAGAGSGGGVAMALSIITIRW